ncbi:DNA-directed RNA polymerase subunit omega [Alteribacter natronophilus]|uniref:DNA-directed RNA polymerase subunit omega n=1 Tax=Alteribacter natronophilus TaxID=2583810 RepID=UPI00110DA6B9|nr:DNA-directed RNA polymerase subunit omega [Alteribacter natronophilus]TMW73164.1 DNA-directed RNA polymerase subunit omega [Alteribacter natronophilus]
MLNPSIDNLMKKINSKYTLVTVSAKRARHLRDNPDGKLKIEHSKSPNLVGKALEEIDAEQIHFEREELKPGEE